MKIWSVSFVDMMGNACNMCYPAMTANEARIMCENDFVEALVVNIEEV